MSFNVTTDAWLPVVDLDGRTEEIGLERLLLDAHRLRRIVGETPPMTAALHRLVLAFAHRVYGPGDEETWGRLWAAETFPDEPLAAYLRRHRDRFDLFDAQRPFLQCPAVAECGRSTAAKLVPHRAAGNNTTLFDHTTAADRLVLMPAEAARWLVTLQAYDPGGTKTPYRAGNTADKSSERAPCNFFGLVLVEGSTLKETLLLNLAVYSPADEVPRMTSADDRPVWEWDAPPGPAPDQRWPRGWTDMLTWLSRRVWLSPHTTGGQTVVDGVVITPGTRFRGELSDIELMAAFRRPGLRGGGKPKKTPPLLPVLLNDRRGVWRHSQELLLAADNDRQRTHTLDHVSEMAECGHIPDGAVYTLRVLGQQLDKNNAVVQHVMEEVVAAPVALMRARHSGTGRIIGRAVELADDIGSALHAMERGFRAEFKSDPSDDLAVAYWPRLGAPFDLFLRDLAEAIRSGRSEVPATEAWADTVRRIADGAARRWAEGSPRQGRNLLAAGKHYGMFTAAMYHRLSTYRSKVAAFVTRERAA